jgi:hypothetical protein
MTKNNRMKKFILAIASASLLVACNNVPQAPAATATTNSLDTAGLAAYQVSKQQPTIITSELAQKEEAAAPVAKAAPVKVRTVTRYVDVPVKRTVRKAAPAPASEPVATANTGSTASTGADQGSMSSGSDNTAKAEQKKGWSKAAKGAVIGGVAGAIGGAVINKKNRGVGAVVGAVIGAGAGYGLGRGQDKKDGRIQIQ